MSTNYGRTGLPRRQAGHSLLPDVVWLTLALAVVSFLFAGNANNPPPFLSGSSANRGLRPALFQTAPLRVKRAQVDRIYLMSTQSQTVKFRFARSVTERRDDYLFVDLWAIDPATATVVWRKRLRTYENDERAGRILPEFAILGADGDTLWLNVEGPIGLSLVDGRSVADMTLIEQSNRAFAGKVLVEPGHVAFGKNGLQLTLSDASQWRIDASDLSAAHRDTPVSHPADIVGPSDFGLAATSRFQYRGSTIGSTWLGVLTDAEADELSHPPVVPGRAPSERPGAMQQFLDRNHVPKPLYHPLPQPYQLWKAQVSVVSAAPLDWPKELPDKWGTREAFSGYAPLPESPSFLRAGLLRENGSAKFPLWYRNPDSVLVLHTDKLGSAGRLQLSRISGPLGKPVWQSILPMVNLGTVMRSENDLVLWGYEPPLSDSSQALVSDKHWTLVRIDVATGKASVLDMTAASMTAPVNE